MVSILVMRKHRSHRAAFPAKPTTTKGRKCAKAKVKRTHTNQPQHLQQQKDSFRNSKEPNLYLDPDSENNCDVVEACVVAEQKNTSLRMSSLLLIDNKKDDHNRLLGHSQQQQQQNTSNSPKSGIIHSIKGNTTNSSSAPTATTAVTPSSPTTGLICGGLKAGSRGSLSQTPPSPSILHSNNTSNNAAHSPTSVVLQHHQQQQQSHKQKQHLQIKSSKGAVDFHLVHAKGIEALGVLVQYLVDDLDAFSCPKLKNDYAQVKQCLYETRRQLEEVKATCHDLQDQLHEKELYYTTRESEIQALHRCELEKVQTSLTDLEASAQDRIRSLEAELISKDVANDKKFKDFIQRTESQLLAKDQEIAHAHDKEQELLKRISSLSTTENELREKVQTAEENFAERLLDAAKRERELVEKVNALTKELENMRQQTCSRERELEDKLNLSHDEIAVLRNSKSFLEHSSSPKKSPGLANGNATKIQMLQEVESLRSVLELKQTELSDLRKQNHELKRASDDVPLLQMKLSASESRVEDLKIQLKAKTEEEKELVSRNKHLQESYKQELETRTRLSLHNEELQWRLKQNSEKFALALNELSKSYSDQGSNFNTPKSSMNCSGQGDSLNLSGNGADNQTQLTSSHNSSLGSLNRTNNGSDRMVGCFQMDDVSPPASPIIKGVVEKNDSVSWVLEMDDETPEVLASRMIRRAGSFRSSFNEKSPNSRRQYSLPATNGANPLSQSASATSVMRQHSSESVALMNSSAPVASSNSRIRSKSVTIKSSEPKKFGRQNSNGAESKNVNGGVASASNASSWKDPLCSSSPYTRHERSGSLKHQLASPTSASPITFGRRSSFCSDEEDRLYRKQSYEPPNLITCDTSALTAAENRLEMRSLPSHPSVQDLKVLKKCHEIQESAGEAMVSGTNSEDEGCSASSDDIISTGSSADSATSSLDCNGTNVKHRVLSLEEAIMNKMSTSLGGTPMEVSWSDDVDQFQSGESIV